MTVILPRQGEVASKATEGADADALPILGHALS